MHNMVCTFLGYLLAALILPTIVALFLLPPILWGKAGAAALVGLVAIGACCIVAAAVGPEFGKSCRDFWESRHGRGEGE